MHSAIIWVKKPSGVDLTDWNNFQKSITAEKAVSANATAMGENVWLVNFRESPASLALIVAFAEKHHIPYGVLPLADAPQWLPSGFSPL